MKDGRSALIEAAIQGNHAIAELLLKFGANPNHQTGVSEPGEVWEGKLTSTLGILERSHGGHYFYSVVV